MGWKGALRSIQAEDRRQEREAQKRQREYAKQQKEFVRMHELEAAATSCCWNNWHSWTGSRWARTTCLGVDSDGKKHVLGVREGASENAEVTSALLEDLVERGLDPGRRRLFVIDGSKALRKAIEKVFGNVTPSSAAATTSATCWASEGSSILR